MTAHALLTAVSTEAGFLASTTERHNYRRIWARDSVIAGLAAAVTGDAKLINTFRLSLITLANHQGRAGQIPSNVEVTAGSVSYGGSAGRVDATLWWLIGCGQYYRATRDAKTIEQLWSHCIKAMQVAQAWEYNDRGLLYVPDTGDWADEYTHGGYVLYDQLLYLRAQEEYQLLVTELQLTAAVTVEPDHLRQLIQANYWKDSQANSNPLIYHKPCYDKASTQSYWLPAFSPFGYRTYFDTWANVLASLFGLATTEQSNQADAYIAKHFAERTQYLLPAFDPVITEQSPAWADLQTAYSFEFKNQPRHYHNGGLWPMITGWYVQDLAKRGQFDLAKRYLAGMRTALADSFYEYIDSAEFKPYGTPSLTWNAASFILAEAACSATSSSTTLW